MTRALVSLALLVHIAPAGASARLLPDTPDRTSIRRLMSSAAARMNMCAQRHHETGNFKFDLKIEPSGRVSAISHQTSPAGRCMTPRIFDLELPSSRLGLQFSYVYHVAAPAPAGPTEIDRARRTIDGAIRALDRLHQSAALTRSKAASLCRASRHLARVHGLTARARSLEVRCRL